MFTFLRSRDVWGDESSTRRLPVSTYRAGKREGWDDMDIYPEDRLCSAGLWTQTVWSFRHEAAYALFQKEKKQLQYALPQAMVY